MAFSGRSCLTHPTPNLLSQPSRSIRTFECSKWAVAQCIYTILTHERSAPLVLVQSLCLARSTLLQTPTDPEKLSRCIKVAQQTQLRSLHQIDAWGPYEQHATCSRRSAIAIARRTLPCFMMQSMGWKSPRPADKKN